MSLLRYLQQANANAQLKEQTKLLKEMARTEGHKGGHKGGHKTAVELKIENDWRERLDREAQGKNPTWEDKVNTWGTECPRHLKIEYGILTEVTGKEASTNKKTRWMIEEDVKEAPSIERPDNV